MSNTNKRKRSASPTDQKSKLLDELDSLKDLLIEQKRQLDSMETEIPMLSEVVEPAPGETDINIPVLEDVAFPPEEEADATSGIQPSQDAESKTAAFTQNETELRKLIDMLVVHRLRQLKPKIREEIIEELQRLKPELFRH